MAVLVNGLHFLHTYADTTENNLGMQVLQTCNPLQPPTAHS